MLMRRFDTMFRHIYDAAHAAIRATDADYADGATPMLAAAVHHLPTRRGRYAVVYASAATLILMLMMPRGELRAKILFIRRR